MILAVPHEAAAGARSRRACVDAAALRGPRREPDRQPPRPLRPPRARRAARRRARLAACSGSSTAPRASGASEGQLVAVSLSHAVEEIGASVVGARADRYLPALERLLPEARGRAGARLRGHPLPARDLPRRARDAQAAARRRDRAPRALPRRRLDRHRLAADDGGRRPQRPRAPPGRRSPALEARPPAPRAARLARGAAAHDRHDRPGDRRRPGEPRPARAGTCSRSSTSPATGRASSRRT